MAGQRREQLTVAPPTSRTSCARYSTTLTARCSGSSLARRRNSSFCKARNQKWIFRLFIRWIPNNCPGNSPEWIGLRRSRTAVAEPEFCFRLSLDERHGSSRTWLPLVRTSRRSSGAELEYLWTCHYDACRLPGELRNLEGRHFRLLDTGRPGGQQARRSEWLVPAGHSSSSLSNKP